jgi:hypothetical protein
VSPVVVSGSKSCAVWFGQCPCAASSGLFRTCWWSAGFTASVYSLVRDSLGPEEPLARACNGCWALQAVCEESSLQSCIQRCLPRCARSCVVWQLHSPQEARTHCRPLVATPLCASTSVGGTRCYRRVVSGLVLSAAAWSVAVDAVCGVFVRSNVYLFLPHDTWHIACDVALTRCVVLAALCMARMSFLARPVSASRGDCSVLRSIRVPCRCPAAWVVCTRCSSIMRPSSFGTLFRTRFPQVWCPFTVSCSPLFSQALGLSSPFAPCVV